MYLCIRVIHQLKLYLAVRAISISSGGRVGGEFRSAEIVEVGDVGNPEISPLLCGATGHGIDCCQVTHQSQMQALSRGTPPKKLNFPVSLVDENFYGTIDGLFHWSCAS